MTTSFLASIALELKSALDPLAAALTSADGMRSFVRRFGWTVDAFSMSADVDATTDTSDDAPNDEDPDPPFDDSGILAAIQNALDLQALFDNLQSAADTLENSTDEEDAAGALLNVAGALTKSLVQLAMLADNPPALPFPLGEPDLWREVPPLLVDELLASYLEDRWPPVYGTLVLLGIIDLTVNNPTGAYRAPWVARQVRWSRIADLLTDPRKLSQDVYHWDDPNAPFDATKLVAMLQIFLWSVGFPARRVSTPAPRLRVPMLTAGSPGTAEFLEAGISVWPIGPAGNNQGTPVGIALSPALTGALQAGNTPGPGEPGFTLSLAGDFSTDSAFALAVRPQGIAFEVGGAAGLSATLGIEGRANPTWLVVGAPGSHRLEVDGLHAQLGVTGTTADPEFRFEIGTGSGATPGKVRFILQFTDSDGFLQKIFGSEPQTAESALALRWSSKTGFSFAASVGITLRMPIHLSLGDVIVIDVLTIGLAASTLGEAAAALTLALSASVKLGPVSGSVDQVGARLLAVPTATGASGTFGSLDLQLAFKPPDGAGLSIKAGPVTGGGYLSFDEVNEQYAGIIQLSFKTISVTAIGLVTTRLPDDSGAPGATKKGFSLLVIIAIDLPPIQLGYGFTLNGVGGLLGVNRAMVVDALRDGVRDGSVNAILFPQDAIARAPQIISQLRTIFPPAEGRYVFGPMVKIGWGPNAILELSAALVLELAAPIRLVILGRIQAALPDKTSTVLNLRLDIVGVVDFDRGEISVDASLVDSRLVAFVLTGDMALRVGWGATKMFALAAGGFHPGFQPPPGFPALHRLAIALADSDNPRLRMETYLALTANTIQFGALLDAYVKVDTFLGSFSASANLSFDALIQFQPFELNAELGAAVDISLNDKPMLHAALHASLTGPTPWHAIGYAEFDFLGNRRIDFEATVGQPATPPVASIDPGQILDQVIAAFTKADAWAALPPLDSDRIVSIRDQSGSAGTFVVHPLGELAARQRVVPLGQTLDRFGAAVVAPTAFQLDGFSVNSGGIAQAEQDTFDDFAPGQFTALSDDERIARPAFESMRSGGSVAVPSTPLPVDQPEGVAGDAGYQEEVIDVEPETQLRSRRSLSDQRAAASFPDRTAAYVVKGGAAAHAQTRSAGPVRFRGPPLSVSVQPERYVLADANTLSPVPGAVAESAAEAYSRRSSRPASAPASAVVMSREAA